LPPAGKFAYNFGVQTPYTQLRAIANSLKALAHQLGLPDSLAELPAWRFESMTYMIYHVLRRLPRPLLVGLLIVFLSAVARA
jgi:hypothetical protein